MTDPQSEFAERYGGRGPKGDQGEQGEPGPRLPRGQARSVVALFLIAFALTAANLIFTAYYVRDQQHAQQQAGQLVEMKLCSTLTALSALKPPAGNPHTNPSRAYLQRQAAKLSELGHDLGCGGAR